MQESAKVEQSPWMDAHRGASYAGVSRKLLYRAIRSGHLKAARVGGRREVRVRREWIDDYLERSACK
jgi:excisionase family DNA binding protein